MVDEGQNNTEEAVYEEEVVEEPIAQLPDADLEIDPDRMYAAMSYLTVLVLVPVLVARDDDFVNFHAKQGIVMLAGLIISLIMANWISFIGSVLFIILLVADVIALMMSLQGKTWRIPVIARIADTFKI